ncbi:hypothetical protein GE09DRAFT_1290880 [Coniochaeta sp. 2T2.1]|nr:hypothetical protein GE09DRAFT_1290880 [Coniochaeta sp. 2T2.1]
MSPKGLTLLVLASTTLASPQLTDRQAHPTAFPPAATALISAYIPAPVYSSLSAAVSSAAAAAHVTGDANSLIYSVLVDASSLPAWFVSAVPSGYSDQLSSLTAAIGSLRPTESGVASLTFVSAGQPTPASGTVVGGIGSVSVETSSNLLTIQTDTRLTSAPTTESEGESGGGETGATPTVRQTVVVTTTTDSAGAVVTTSFTSAVVVTDATTGTTGEVVTTTSGSGSGTTSTSSPSRTATTSSSSSGTNAAALVRPTGAVAGLVGLIGLIAAL